MRSIKLPVLLAGLMLPAAALAQAAPAEDLRFVLPKTVSPQAAAVLKPGLAAQKAMRPQRMAMALDFAALRAMAEKDVDTKVAATAAAYKVTYAPDTVGGVPVLRVTPQNAATDGRVLVYIHGGGWIGGSPKSAFRLAAIYASATGLPVVSVDYGLAPEHDFRDITGQAVAVYKALIAQGHKPGQIGLYGDSAGGNIILGSTLRMRDEGLPLPAALVALSPAVDLGNDGDTRTTLAYVDPVLDNQAWLDAVMKAYAGADVGAGMKNPWASPVLGDYSRPFPATLIQGGTREYLMSDFIREYQAIRMGGGEAVLDLYEGMPHVFMGFLSDTPEGKQAIGTARDFLLKRLAKQ
ncbi:alpha/beta hydrolase [Sphingomonas sp.]|uniref:alpha/beta hydrolase n=1 Tax=Sphingomonas sp. TaxID=28214 RepID=UPI001B0D4A22|nr:alpha/beta hydrolase [Sphingomonas sp.]MBO9713874.1 alpha/beta hydrolase [Sphingomonas sp.]